MTKPTTIITLSAVKACLKDIEEYAGDPEAAHAKQDVLYLNVLRQLAQDGNRLAAEAIKANDIEFDRWFP